MATTAATPPRWHEVYRNDDEKCLFVGKDGCSGLIRAKDKDGKRFEWRSTDKLATEAGLTKKRTEEILEYYANKGVVRQHAKDPEKWGYWVVVGVEKADPDLVKKDHEDRMTKSSGTAAGNGGVAVAGALKAAPAKKATSTGTKTPAKAP